jgi:hypothetical protein
MKLDDLVQSSKGVAIHSKAKQENTNFLSLILRTTKHKIAIILS